MLEDGYYVGRAGRVLVLERVIVLAAIVFTISVAALFLYLLVFWIIGRRRLREPFTLQQFGVDLLLLAGRLGFLASALQFVMLDQDVYDLALPTEVTQGLNVALAELAASSATIVICVGSNPCGRSLSASAE